jgi:hypothetical protein
MINFTRELQEQFDKQLAAIDPQQYPTLKKTEYAISVSQEFVCKLKQFIDRYTFKDQQEEIQFFKEIKPSIFSKLIFYVTIYRIESKIPDIDAEVKRKFLKKELKKLKTYFNKNHEFYMYYRAGRIHLDNTYFVRGHTSLNLDLFYFEADPSFTTTYDYKIAEILAYERVCDYIKKQLQETQDSNSYPTAINTQSSSLTWTSSKISLVELIYALHASGTFNNGQSDVKEIAEFMEGAFNIELGNYYHTYLDIKKRKTNQTQFLQKLNMDLSDQINNSSDKQADQ